MTTEPTLLVSLDLAGTFTYALTEIERLGSLSGWSRSARLHDL
jgi:hypothetical protein